MKQYTEDFKKQAIDLAKTLGSIKKTAEQLGITRGNALE
jgi:transposase-like protein